MYNIHSCATNYSIFKMWLTQTIKLLVDLRKVISQTSLNKYPVELSFLHSGFACHCFSSFSLESTLSEARAFNNTSVLGCNLPYIKHETQTVKDKDQVKEDFKIWFHASWTCRVDICFISFLTSVSTKQCERCLLWAFNIFIYN